MLKKTAFIVLSMLVLAGNSSANFNDNDADSRESYLFKKYKASGMSKSEKQFFSALGEKESSGNYAKVNRFGYIGKYQFGEQALITLGYYNKDGSVKNDWRGRWAGKHGISSKQDFLNSPAVQDEAVRELAEFNWKFAKQKGLHKYIGNKVKGVNITKAGILAGMHLKGGGGVINFVIHMENSKDGFGTEIRSYVSKFANYEIASLGNTNTSVA